MRNAVITGIFILLLSAFHMTRQERKLFGKSCPSQTEDMLMHIDMPLLPFFSSGFRQTICWFSFCALKGSAQGTPPLDRNWSNKALTACGNFSTRIVLGSSSWKLYTWCLSALLHSPPWFLMRQVLNWCIAATEMPPANAVSCEPLEKRKDTCLLHDSVIQTSCVRW